MVLYKLPVKCKIRGTQELTIGVPSGLTVGPVEVLVFVLQGAKGADVTAFMYPHSECADCLEEMLAE